MKKYIPEILYEDNHLLVINKPAGMLVQGDRTGDLPLSEHLKLFLKEKYNKPGNVFMGVTHRIDRPVSGVLVFAKTGKALTRLNNMFKEKEIQKTYWAVVKNKPKQLTANLVHYLIKNQQKNKSRAYTQAQKNTKRSELNYQWLASSDRYHLLEVKPLTGRHHQIRVQLASIGCAIKGDLKYGFPRSNKDASIHLHARKIELIHPVKKEPLIIEAPIPNNDVVWNVLATKVSQVNYDKLTPDKT